VCGHLNEQNTAEFARRLLQLSCAGGTTAIQDIRADRPAMLTLEPNPTRGSTIISYRAQEAVDSSLEIYNVKGEFVRTIRIGIVQPGDHELVWDGRNDAGRLVSSGVYLFSLQLGKTKLTGRSILIH
jgi:flagellar hook assembly protein FlgD